VPAIRRLPAGKGLGSESAEVRAGSKPGVSLGIYATVLFVLGFAERLGDLADPGTDELGLALEEKRLPQRIRRPRKPAQGTPGGASLP